MGRRGSPPARAVLLGAENLLGELDHRNGGRIHREVPTV